MPPRSADRSWVIHAWRRLERRLEDKHTAELTSDFDDYNIDDDSTAVRKMNNSKNLS